MTCKLCGNYTDLDVCPECQQREAQLTLLHAFQQTMGDSLDLGYNRTRPIQDKMDILEKRIYYLENPKRSILNILLLTIFGVMAVALIVVLCGMFSYISLYRKALLLITTTANIALTIFLWKKDPHEHDYLSKIANCKQQIKALSEQYKHEFHPAYTNYEKSNKVLPIKYASSAHIASIIQYIENKQASTIASAITVLEQDRRHNEQLKAMADLEDAILAPSVGILIDL